MADIGTQLESFPFDSSPDLTYDDNGDPRYDRAVGARVLRDTFAKFFSDGVFPSPGTALQISKGDGLKVNVGAGVCIIKGAMGGLYDDAVVTLDSAAPQGNVAYGLMLRYDNNRYDDGTGQAIYLRVAKGDAASDPQPPEPDRTTPGVYELRLGYVVVRNGATSVQAADVHNEKGTAVCPFAAPFMQIDVSQFTADLKNSGREALDLLLADFDKFRDLISQAVDGTLAGQLQAQINELKNRLDALGKVDLSNEVDNKTVFYEVPESGGLDKKLVAKPPQPNGKTVYYDDDGKLAAKPNEDGTFGGYSFLLKTDMLNALLSRPSVAVSTSQRTPSPTGFLNGISSFVAHDASLVYLTPGDELIATAIMPDGTASKSARFTVTNAASSSCSYGIASISRGESETVCNILCLLYESASSGLVSPTLSALSLTLRVADTMTIDVRSKQTIANLSNTTYEGDSRSKKFAATGDFGLLATVAYWTRRGGTGDRATKYNISAYPVACDANGALTVGEAASKSTTNIVYTPSRPQDNYFDVVNYDGTVRSIVGGDYYGTSGESKYLAISESPLAASFKNVGSKSGTESVIKDVSKIRTPYGGKYAEFKGDGAYEVTVGRGGSESRTKVIGNRVSFLLNSDYGNVSAGQIGNSTGRLIEISDGVYILIVRQYRNGSGDTAFACISQDNGVARVVSGGANVGDFGTPLTEFDSFNNGKFATFTTRVKSGKKYLEYTNSLGLTTNVSGSSYPIFVEL